MKKSLVTGFFALLFLLCADFCFAETYGDFEYSVKNGSVTITKYTGKSTVLAIPSKIKSKPVTAIGNRAFFYCGTLRFVTIPNSVTDIGKSAFSGCKSLISLTIPDSVTAVGESAFSDCKSFISVTIPDSLTFIGSSAFSGCSALKTIRISKNHPVYRFSAGALVDKTTKTLHTYLCSAPTPSYTIPSGILAIGDRAFSNCTALTSVTIPKSVTGIGKRAFSGCYSLHSVTIPNSVTAIGDWAFLSCESLIIELEDESGEPYRYCKENKIPVQFGRF